MKNSLAKYKSTLVIPEKIEKSRQIIIPVENNLNTEPFLTPKFEFVENKIKESLNKKLPPTIPENLGLKNSSEYEGDPLSVSNIPFEDNAGVKKQTIDSLINSSNIQFAKNNKEKSVSSEKNDILIEKNGEEMGNGVFNGERGLKLNNCKGSVTSELERKYQKSLNNSQNIYFMIEEQIASQNIKSKKFDENVFFFFFNYFF